MAIPGRSELLRGIAESGEEDQEVRTVARFEVRSEHRDSLREEETTRIREHFGCEATRTPSKATVSCEQMSTRNQDRRQESARVSSRLVRGLHSHSPSADSASSHSSRSVPKRFADRKSLTCLELSDSNPTK